jgi:hypothetical protein
MQCPIRWVKWTSGLFRSCLRHSFGIPSVPQAFLSFRDSINFCKSNGLILWREPLSAASRRSWFSSHRSCGVNYLSKQSAIVLAFPNGWNFIPKGPWIAVGALSPSLFVRSFSMGQFAWGVTSDLAIFDSHRSSALLRVMRLIVFEIKSNALLHIGSLVSCHSFLNLFLCFSNLSKPGISLFNSEGWTLLYAEVMGFINLSAALSDSTPELISILDDIKVETRFWNRSQFANFLNASGSFLMIQHVEYYW